MSDDFWCDVCEDWFEAEVEQWMTDIVECESCGKKFWVEWDETQDGHCRCWLMEYVEPEKKNTVKIPCHVCGGKGGFDRDIKVIDAITKEYLYTRRIKNDCGMCMGKGVCEVEVSDHS